jgi:hypothetical protein
MGDEYLIGYRLTTHNSTLISDRITVSKSMVSCVGEKKETLFLSRQANQTLQSLLITHEDEFLEFASQQPINVESTQNISNNGQNSTDSMTLPIQCYIVDFNDDSVTLSLLK